MTAIEEEVYTHRSLETKSQHTMQGPVGKHKEPPGGRGRVKHGRKALLWLRWEGMDESEWTAEQVQDWLV